MYAFIYACMYEILHIYYVCMYVRMYVCMHVCICLISKQTLLGISDRSLEATYWVSLLLQQDRYANNSLEA